jgi:hypothetical protein
VQCHYGKLRVDPFWTQAIIVFSTRLSYNKSLKALVLNPQKKIVVCVNKRVKGSWWTELFFHFFLERSSSIWFFGRKKGPHFLKIHTFFATLQDCKSVFKWKILEECLPNTLLTICLSPIAKNDPPHPLSNRIYSRFLCTKPNKFILIELNTTQNTDLPKKIKSYVVEAFKLYKGMTPLKRVGMSVPTTEWIG